MPFQKYIESIFKIFITSCYILKLYKSRIQNRLYYTSLMVLSNILLIYFQGILLKLIVVVQSLGCVQLFMTLWTAALQASLSFTISQSLHKLMSIELMMPANHLILCCSLLLLPSIFPRIRVFPNQSTLHIRWPKYWSFSFSISPSNEYSGLVSFRIDWFDLLALHGTLKSLLQHCNLKASIFQCSSFFMVQLTSVHDYWRNHSFDYTELCQQNNVSVF